RRELLEALALAGLREVEPELEDERALAREHPLEAADLLHPLIEIRVRRLAVRAPEDRIGVPGREEDPGLALRRQLPPEAPRGRALGLLGGLRVERVDLH